MANNTFSLYGVKLDSNVIGGITDMQPSRSAQALIQGGSGAVYPSYGGIMKSDDRVQFTTLQLAQMLALCGIVGYAPTTADFAFQLNTEMGARAATYRKLASYKTLIVPRRLSLAQNREATLSVEALACGDASNAPFSLGTGSLSFTQAITEKFTLGPMQINGTDVQLQSLDHDFGLDVKPIENNGSPWCLGYWIGEAKPVTEIVTNDLTLLSLFVSGTALGLAVTSAVFFAQKIAEGGDARVAAATEEHIKFTIEEAVAHMTSAGGGHGSEAPLSARIEHVYDGTNAITQIDTTAAIAFA